MKIIPLLLLGSMCIFLPKFVSAQDAIEPMSYYKIWGGDSPDTYDIIDSIKEINIFKDSTTFQQRIYSKNVHENTFDFYVKSGKVYRIGSEKHPQFLMFDFTLTKGDTFIYKGEASDTFTLLVDSTGYMTLANKDKRKTIYLSNANVDEQIFGQQVWIEGIGSLNEGFSWILTRVFDIGYTTTLSICNSSESIYWAGGNEKPELHCDFNYLDTYLSVNDELSISITPSIYPNPSTGFIQLDAALLQNRFTIYSLNGSVLKSGITQPSLNLTDLDSGIYLFEVKNRENVSIQKLVIY